MSGLDVDRGLRRGTCRGSADEPGRRPALTLARTVRRRAPPCGACRRSGRPTAATSPSSSCIRSSSASGPPGGAHRGCRPADALRLLARPGDVLLAVSTADDRSTVDLLRRAEAWGLTRIWLGPGRAPAGRSRRPRRLARKRGSGPAARSGDLVLLYHLLWELTHVVFEHPGLLAAPRSSPTCTRRGVHHLLRRGRRGRGRGPSATAARPRSWLGGRPQDRRRHPGRPGGARRPDPGPRRCRHRRARGRRRP